MKKRLATLIFIVIVVSMLVIIGFSRFNPLSGFTQKGKVQAVTRSYEKLVQEGVYHFLWVTSVTNSTESETRLAGDVVLPDRGRLAENIDEQYALLGTKTERTEEGFIVTQIRLGDTVYQRATDYIGIDPSREYNVWTLEEAGVVLGTENFPFPHQLFFSAASIDSDISVKRTGATKCYSYSLIKDELWPDSKIALYQYLAREYYLRKKPSIALQEFCLYTKSGLPSSITTTVTVGPENQVRPEIQEKEEKQQYVFSIEFSKYGQVGVVAEPPPDAVFTPEYVSSEAFSRARDRFTLRSAAASQEEQWQKIKDPSVLERDTKRKEDLLSLATALEFIIKEKDVLPQALFLVKIGDANEIHTLLVSYFNTLPSDPDPNTYYYGFKSPDGKSWEITAIAENKDDPQAESVGAYRIFRLTAEKKTF